MNSQFPKKFVSVFKGRINNVFEVFYRGLNKQISNNLINSKIELKYMDTQINHKRVSRLTYLRERMYAPTPYMAHSFLQSVFNITFSDTLKVNYKRELVKLHDGGQISLDWANPIDNTTNLEYEPSDSNKILFIIHGLTGGSNMNYIKSMIKYAQTQGYRCVAFNSRGINTELTTPKPFNCGCIQDLDFALDYVRQRYPNAPILGVGASFGSNMLLRWAGNKKEKNFLVAMAGISTPYDIKQCAINIGYVYEGFFVYRYKASFIDPHKHVLKQLENTHNIDFKKVEKVRNLKEFHEELSIKLFGYKSVEEYINKQNVQPHQLQNVTAPCLLMHSKDDPIVTYSCVPSDLLKQNPQIIQAETSHGAHVCWYNGLSPERWYPKPIIQFFETILEEQKH